MRVKCIFIFLWIIFSLHVKANPADTLGLAKSFIQKGKFRKAERILSLYEQSHPNDLNTLWLHAQTAYWAGHSKASLNLYAKAINRFPSNYYLRLDYAIKLVDNGEIEKAKPLLDLYKKYDPGSNDLRLVNAKLAYWEGDYATALQLLNNESLKKEKPNETQSLKEEVLAAKSPWLRVNADCMKDDQPLQVITPGLDAGLYVNTFFSPFVSVSNPVFKTDSASTSSVGVQLGNKFQFIKSHCLLTIHGGFMQLPDHTRTGTGGIEITKTSFKHFEITAEASRQPYLVTISSLSGEVVLVRFALNAGWNNTSSWNGRIGGSLDDFNRDNNYIYNLSAWLFAPPLKFRSFRLRLGYAYGYSHAKESRYMARESIKSIVSNYPNNKVVSGIYDPYFTPNHQQVHSVLVNVSYHWDKRLSLGLNTSIGFIGKTDDPYLFLNKSSNNELFIDRGYSTVNFHPHKLDASVLYRVFPKCALKATYSFLTNNFYTRHAAGLSLIINFWNE
jgi:tetratricopeptide (TPR) repeat protein